MKREIIIFGIGLSILFLSVSIHNLAAQNVTPETSIAGRNLTVSNVSSAAGNLTVSNVSSAAGNLTVSANETLAEFGQQLSNFVKDLNKTVQSGNSSPIQLGQNASDIGIQLQNDTADASN